MANARKIAARALLRVNQDHGYSNIVWDQALHAAGLNERDSALAAALFYGVLERRKTLDYVISKHSKRGLDQIAPYTLECLRLGAYQLLYMDKIPPSAAVNESVRLVKESKEHKAFGFVNGVLRSVERGGREIPLPNDPMDRLCVEYSCPRALAEHFMEDYGKDLAKDILASFLERQRLYIRVNTCKTTADALRERLTAEGIKVHACEIENCLLLENSGDLQRLASFQEGLFHVQDMASQLCVKALGLRPGGRLLDVCAAPGGKSFTAAQFMEDRGEVTALDLYPQRVGLIRQGAKRLGLSSICAKEGDAGTFDPALGFFDWVLCDLPCSGLGIIGKKPEIRYLYESAGYNLVTNLDKLAAKQYSLLCISAQYVKPGGVLLFSTCTLNRLENEGNANRFLDEHGDFAPLEILPYMERGYSQPGHILTLLPHMHHTDGFFLAAFVKKR